MLAVALALAALTQAPRPPAPQAIVTRAVNAMGGEAALRDLRTLTVEFYTATFGIGQEETPSGPARASFAIGRTQTDYAGGRQTGTIELRGPGGMVNQLRRVTAGQIGLLETNGRQAPDNPATVANAERGMRRATERVLLAALANPAALKSLPNRRWRSEPHVGVRYAAGPDTVDLYFEERTGLPGFTETVTDDPILGDRRTISAWGRWQPATGSALLYPRQYDIEVNGRLQTHSVFTAVTVNAPLADSLFVIPDSIASRAQRSNPTPAPITVSLVELAPGVWRAEGGSHHSLVVEQESRLVIVEAPQSNARMQAVLDTLKSRFGKTVALVVNTHHHWDHSGGLRTVLAAVLPVATHSRNATFVQSIASAAKSIQPDALMRRPRRPQLTVVDDSLVVGAGDNRVVLYRFPTAHVEGMLAAYLPGPRLLFQSDVLAPGPTLAPAGSAEIVRFVRARGITVDRVVGGHGGVAMWADVERAAAP
jgi:glyoxylase-like metal-dependent hydrolase (beta-lactamase superfamily II)